MQNDSLLRYSVLLIALVFAALVLQTFQSVLRPLAIASILIFALSPLARLSRERNVPVAVVFAGLAALGGLGVWLLVSNGISSAAELRGALPSLESEATEEGGELLERLYRLGVPAEAVTPAMIGEWTRRALMLTVSTSTSLILELLLVLIFLLFLIPSYPFAVEWIRSRQGDAAAVRAIATHRKIESDIGAYVLTKSAMSLGTAGCSLVALYLFGARFLFMSAMLIFILNFIPVVGSLVAVAIVMVLYVLSFDAGATAVGLLGVLIVIQVLFGNVLEPKIAGDRLNLSPILIVVSLALWGWIWGTIGMLISVPLTLVILIAIRHLAAEPRTGDERI